MSISDIPIDENDDREKERERERERERESQKKGHFCDENRELS